MLNKLMGGITGAWLLLGGMLACSGSAVAQAQTQPELLVYCGITLVRPMTEIAHSFEQKENIKITIAQGGSEDLYQSAKKSCLLYTSRCV